MKRNAEQQSAKEELLCHDAGKKDQRHRAQNQGKAEITFFLVWSHGKSICPAQAITRVAVTSNFGGVS